MEKTAAQFSVDNNGLLCYAVVDCSIPFKEVVTTYRLLGFECKDDKHYYKLVYPKILSLKQYLFIET